MTAATGSSTTGLHFHDDLYELDQLLQVVQVDRLDETAWKQNGNGNGKRIHTGAESSGFRQRGGRRESEFDALAYSSGSRAQELAGGALAMKVYGNLRDQHSVAMAQRVSFKATQPQKSGRKLWTKSDGGCFIMLNQNQNWRNSI